MIDMIPFFGHGALEYLVISTSAYNEPADLIFMY